MAERKTKIFLSCASSEFGSYRLKLANQLGALQGELYLVKVQEDFPQGGYTLLESLAQYIEECEWVVHLVGDACGARPTLEHEKVIRQRLGEVDSPALVGWSYTQWEYYLARYFHKRILVYFAQPEAGRDCELPFKQNEEDAQLQKQHGEAIRVSGEHWKTFSSQHEFSSEVFYDLGLDFGRKVNNLPFKSLGTLFKGRDRFLEQIRTTLSQAEFRGHQRVAAITASATAATVYGLGGIGKTRAAIEFAHKYADDFTALLFVRADSPENLKKNLAALCSPSVLDLTEKEAKELEVQFAAALHWFQQHPGWLIIFDSVDTETVIKAVGDLLGKITGAGQVLITSRISQWPGALETLSLDVLAEHDATDFLLERTEKRRRKQPDDESQAQELAILLGRLALALEQAGAMIDTKRMTFAQYKSEWEKCQADVLAWFDERLMQYPMSVAVTWQTSFDQLSDSAQELLHRLAWLAPDPIPESLLEVSWQESENEVQQANKGTFNGIEALEGLEKFSLVTREDDRPHFFVHRLVQTVTRLSMQKKSDHRALVEAANWLNNAFAGDPADVRDWTILDPLAPHVHACVLFVEKDNIHVIISRLLAILGGLFRAKAQYEQAEPLLRKALAIAEASFGENDPRVAIHLNNVAHCLQDTNRLAEAEPLLKRALTICEAHNGENHTGNIFVLNNLAFLLYTTNRIEEAELLYRRALAIIEANTEKRHDELAVILGIINNLAQLLQNTDRMVEAEPLMRQALATDEAYYGEDHPRVAIDLSNLAALLVTIKRITEAEPLVRRALAIDEKNFGRDHPNIAIRLNNLAQILQDTNRIVEAEPLMRRALAIDEAKYGENHPRVASELSNLAILFKRTNRVTEAEPLLRCALAIDEASYGENHPKVAIRLDNLAQMLLDIGRIAEAESLLWRAISSDEASFGKSHPKVATRLIGLANVLCNTNRGTDAEPLIRRALEINEMNYGENDLSVARCLDSLANLFCSTNRVTEAEVLLRRSLGIDEEIFGKNHPSIALTLSNLAFIFSETHRVEEAKRFLRRAVKILAKDSVHSKRPHPNFDMMINNYIQLLMEIGFSKAQALQEVNAILRECGNGLKVGAKSL